MNDLRYNDRLRDILARACGHYLWSLALGTTICRSNYKVIMTRNAARTSS